MAHEKIFILDTNVLMYDPESIFSFNYSLIGIPIIVLEELDTFKSESTDRGASTRRVIRHLDHLRSKGSLKDGVQLENQSTLKVLFLPEKCETITCTPFKMDLADNEILMTALYFKHQGWDVQFISKDLNARVKADVLGISAQDYVKGHICKESFYKGWLSVPVPAIQLKKDHPEELDELLKEGSLTPNQFILLESRHNPFHNKIYRYLGGEKFKIVTEPAFRWPLEPRNPQQLMALDLLLDVNVQLVTLIGPAGTGKTFMALLAGLDQILVHDQYSRLLISRPVIPLGPDIGYLPGTIEEKLHSWMQPIYDNMDFIMHAANVAQPFEYYNEEPTYNGKRGMRKHAKEVKYKKRSLQSLDELVKEGKISLEAITYMRGRSIPFQYILIDEVQNLTPHEVKTLISRVGEGSKIILAGDPYQIDSPYLDFSSNGLMVASSKFIGQTLYGTVYLENSERSALSKLVSELL